MRYLLKSANITSLQRKIAYKFNNEKLIKNALTHRSAGATNNERLEFLGDSILSIVIADSLYHNFPNASEGELSRLRSYLVKGETLAVISRELKLGDYLLLGQGELKSGGFRRDSILADCFEAMIAAIYLDSNFEQVKKIILNIYETRIKDNNIFNHLKDFKTMLQEYLQSNKLDLPKYELLSIGGEQHNQQFEVLCEVPSMNIKTEGKGTTRRKAEKIAAEKMLQQLLK